MDEKPKKRKKREKQKYSGPLAKQMSPGRLAASFPISSLLRSSFFGPVPVEVLDSELAADSENFLLLMDHYGIDRIAMPGQIMLCRDAHSRQKEAPVQMGGGQIGCFSEFHSGFKGSPSSFLRRCGRLGALPMRRWSTSDFPRRRS